MQLQVGIRTLKAAGSRRVAAIVLGMFSIGAPAMAIEFVDGDFTSGWQYVSVTTGNGGSFSTFVDDEGFGGNPGNYLVTSTSVAGDCSAIYGFGFNTNAVYDPSELGPLESFDYSEDAKLIDGFGGGQANGPAIRQGGKLYRIPGLGTDAIFTWHTFPRSAVHASEFVRVLGGACGADVDPDDHPDFSSTGGPIEFGFVRANSQIDGQPPYSITGAIDNWKVTLKIKMSYAALGDSYSAGEGLLDYFPETAMAPINSCHRSPRAYGFMVSFPNVELDTDNFIPCSGALTVNVLSMPPGYPPSHAPFELPQLDRTYPPPDDERRVVGPHTSMVSLTIGGNDAGFDEILKMCWLHDCLSDTYRPFLPDDSRSLKQWVDAKLLLLGNNAAAVYQAIRNRATNGAVFALGYPKLFGTGDCPFDLQPFGLIGYFTEEKAWMDELSSRLNATLRQAAANVGVHFVPVSFDGHEACTPHRWVEEWNVTLNPTGSFHPNALGQGIYATTLNKYLRDKVNSGWPTLPTGIPENPAPALALAASSTETTVVPSLGPLIVTPAATPPCGAGEAFVAGQQVQVRGARFAASATITLHLQSGAYAADFATLTADAAGEINEAVNLPPLAQPAAIALLEAHGIGESGEARLLLATFRVSTSFMSDEDGDGIPDPCDNCPMHDDPNPDDTDGDGLGDACDACPLDPDNDLDSDGLCAQDDPCPWDAANDADGDGWCEFEDNCPNRFNNQQDSDLDGRGDACDLLRFDPSLYAFPEEVRGLAFDADRKTLSWISTAASSGFGTVHDIVRGTVDLLPVGTADDCFMAGNPGETAEDPGLPPSGTSFYYLVRGRNGSAWGPYGSASDGTPRETEACP